MYPSQKTNPFKTEKIIWALLLAILAIWSYFSYHNWISDSEFWPISLSGHWNQWKTQSSLLYKPLFHLSLAWIYAFDLDSVNHLRVAKGFYTLLGVSSFIVFFLILKNQLDIRKAFCIVLIFLLSHLGFTQIGLIRSDFLSYFIALLFLLFIPRISSDQWLKLSFMSYVFSVGLILTTPKSLFFAVLVFMFSLLHLNKQVRFRYFLTFGWLFIFTYFGFYFLFPVGFQQGLQSVMSYAMSSYKSLDDIIFFTFQSGYFINDIHLWTIFLVGLIFQVFKVKRDSLWPWTILGLLTWIIIILFKPALAFFIGSYWGFLFLSLIPSLKSINIKYFIGLLFVSLVIFMTHFTFTYYFPNSVQLQAVSQIEDMVKEIPNGKIFDGLGLVPRSSQALFYVGPYEEQSNLEALNFVMEKKPELIIYTNRMEFLEPDLGQLLRNEYQSVGIGYWLRKDIKISKTLEKLRPSFFVFGFYPVPSMLKVN